MKLITVSLGVLAISSCGLFGPSGNGVPDSIDNFVSEYSFPKQQNTQLSFSDENSNVYIFYVLYGDGMDCPSGCIYSRMIGLKVDDHIGWLWGEYYALFDSSEYDYFDVNKGDSAMFDQGLWDDLYEDDYWIFHNQFLPTVARDIDTPPAVLLSVSERLYVQRVIGVADILMSNPIARADSLVLKSIACLPDVHGNTYDDAREIARALLGEDYTGCD